MLTIITIITTCMQSHSKGVVHYYNLANTLVVVDHMHAVRYACGSASKVFSCLVCIAMAIYTN